jgi:LDH2 family malate/lactate/ureidoglycolate dehydrogenase
MSPAEARSLINEERLLSVASAALERFGMTASDARDASRILVLADLFGIHTHGVERIGSYVERMRLGGINPRPRITREVVAPALVRIDGDNGVGPLIGVRALEAATEIARQTGVAAVFARGSNHFGAIAPYTFMAAEAGFASIIGSNATTTMAPWGGREARLGNNPLAFGIPNPKGRPVILDMALSVAARAKIRNALERGETIPPTWATDRDGRPTTDPRQALSGFLLPIGGYKGSGLALIVDGLAGLLSGAAYLTHVGSWVDAPAEPQNLGHIFIVIDTARLGTSDWLASRIADFCEILRGTPPADPNQPVLVPGEIELERLERQRRDGIMLDARVIAELERWAAG